MHTAIITANVVHKFNEYGDASLPCWQVQVTLPTGAMTLVEVALRNGTWESDASDHLISSVAIVAAQQSA